ncbi:MAG: ATP-binding protein [Saprospiraceae bacterium]
MNLLLRLLNIGVSGDLTNLEKLARRIFNFDNLMGMLLPLSTILMYAVNGVLTPWLFFWHLLIISYFATNLYFVARGYYKVSVFVTIGVIYLMMTIVVFAFLNLFNALFFLPLSLNALIYFPERKKVSIAIFCLFMVSAALFFVVEISHFQFGKISAIQFLNMKAAILFFSYLFLYKVFSLLLMYWRTLSQKNIIDKGMRNFLEYTSEGIYHITFLTPIPVGLPLDEQHRIFKQTGYFEECNDAFANIYGYQHGHSMKGLSIQNLREGVSNANIPINFKDVVQANYQYLDVESRAFREDGQVIDLLNNVIGIVEDGQLKGLWGTQKDITELKQSKESIARQDEVIEKMMSNFPVVYYRFDKDLNFTVSLGDGLKRLGFKNNEVVGKSIREIYSQYPDIIAYHDKVLEVGICSYVAKVQTENGEIFFDVRVTYDKEKQEGIGFALETTERKIAENALLESENRYKNLFSNSFEAIFVFNQQRGIFEYCNEQAKSLFGLPEFGETNPLKPQDIVPVYQTSGERSDVLIREHLRILKLGQTLRFEFDHKKIDGIVFETETTLIPSAYNPNEVLVIIKNVSEKKQSEKALRVSELQLKEAQEVALLGSWEYDYATDTLTWSEQLYHLFQIPLGTPVSFESCLMTLVEEELQTTLLDIKNKPVDNVFFNFVYKKVLKETGPRWFQMRGKKVLGKEGRPIRISGIIQDITSKKNQEDLTRKTLVELNQKNEDLKKYIESNMQLENFAYMASHDLKAPIRTIVSFTQLLKRSLGDRLNKNEQEYLSYITSGANSMKNLIEDLLLYSRVNTENHRLETISLYTLIDQIKTDLKIEIEGSNTIIELKTMPDLIDADATMMRQLFQNLLENAIKFRKDEVTPVVEISCSSSDEYWHFSIKDNGIGVGAEFREKVFLLFRKLHNSTKYEGTGIGLALCKKIVEQHGGKIWIDDQYEEGTCFHFTLRKHLILALAEAN